MKVFVTGASGYIGGSVAAALLSAGHAVAGLVRSEQRAAQIQALGMQPVLGTLDDGDVLVRAARQSDAVIHTADSDHRRSAEAMLPALAGSGKLFLQTSGSSIVGDEAGGESTERIYDEDTPFQPGPGRASRVAIDRAVLASADRGVRAVVVCPSMIYGPGRGLHRESIQVPWFVRLAKKHNVALHIGRGENVWSNVHIDDLCDLYLLILERAPAGAFYFAENGENSMRQIAEAISRALGFGGRTASMSIERAAVESSEPAARYTYGSNSRVRAMRARRELGWSPKRPSLLATIAAGL